MSSSIDGSDGPKSNKKSEGFVFLDTLPSGGGGGATEKKCYDPQVRTCIDDI